jgi:hypothetical protein
MKRTALGIVVCLAMVAPVAFAARGHKQASPEQTPPLPSNYKVPLIAEGLKLSDFEGMAPKAALKGKLLHLSGFIQSTPSDGVEATEETEVWLGYSKTALYVVFICHDMHPDQVRTHLARREDISADDTVTMLLDPFQDRRKGILFSVNAAGVQADASWTENSGSDYSYDQVWDSDGKVTERGWMALMAIPFRSLRFRPGTSDWGVVFSRSIPRNSEVDHWPHIAAAVSGVLTQEETLRGIEGVTGSRNFQVNPYTLAQNERSLQTLDPMNPFFSSRHFEGTAGGEVKAILKDSVVVDGTLNPDFSDIESEQPQFTVNQRYPVYFPELRPFFLENANYFNTPIDLVYTRNVVHPEFGGRVTGKVNHTNIGFMAADDRSPGECVPAGDPLSNKRALFAVARVSQDIGTGSSIGAIYTDEEFGEGWNRIGGIDFTWRMNDKWSAAGQSVESSTQSPMDASPPTYSAGPASLLAIHRSGHSFNFSGNYKDFSTGFGSNVGFIPTTDLRYGGTYSSYQWYPKHSAIQSYGLELSQNEAWDHQGNRVFHYTNFDPYIQLPRKTAIVPIVGQSSDTVGPQDGYLLTENRNFSENYGGLMVRSAPSNLINFRVSAFYGGNVNYNPVAGQAPSMLVGDVSEIYLTLQPLHQLSASNIYLLDRDHEAADGAFAYEAQTLRTKVNYQFTKAFSARAIVEYDSTLANPAETSLLRTKQVGTQALLTWLPHPGTAIYVGYNNDLQNLDRSLCNRLPDGDCDPNNTTPPRALPFLNDGRQIFIKASYLFRF